MTAANGLPGGAKEGLDEEAGGDIGLGTPDDLEPSLPQMVLIVVSKNHGNQDPKCQMENVTYAAFSIADSDL